MAFASGRPMGPRSAAKVVSTEGAPRARIRALTPDELIRRWIGEVRLFRGSGGLRVVDPQLGDLDLETALIFALPEAESDAIVAAVEQASGQAFGISGMPGGRASTAADAS